MPPKIASVSFICTYAAPNLDNRLVVSSLANSVSEKLMFGALEDQYQRLDN